MSKAYQEMDLLPCFSPQERDKNNVTRPADIAIVYRNVVLLQYDSLGSDEENKEIHQILVEGSFDSKISRASAG